MLILGHEEVQTILEGREHQTLEIVEQTYLRHARGESVLPHSTFLRPTPGSAERIIALPAHLGGAQPITGLKWIASYPANLDAGVPRASAVIVLNSTRTGRPVALLEASGISARRTGASAALAARTLPGERPDTGVALVGCGVINLEVLRFLRLCVPTLAEATVHDLEPERANRFARRCAALWPDLRVTVATGAREALSRHRLASLATTATQPHLPAEACPPGSLVLHVSLRDLTVDAVLASDNVVDDPDHVCRAATSLHLAEQRVGDRRFIRTTIGDLLADGSPQQRRGDRVTVFSPFGLGVLDIALADLVHAAARSQRQGTLIDRFLPEGVLS